MRALLMLFWLLAAATLQSVVPPWSRMGRPVFPFLLTVVLYAALHRPPPWVYLVTALLAGVVADSLSEAPLGYSFCSFLAGAAVVRGLRKNFYADKVRLMAVFGALGSAAATAVLLLLLRLEGRAASGPAGRIWGAALVGAILTPLMLILMRGMERRLGTWEDRF